MSQRSRPKPLLGVGLRALPSAPVVPNSHTSLMPCQASRRLTASAVPTGQDGDKLGHAPPHRRVPKRARRRRVGGCAGISLTVDEAKTMAVFDKQRRSPPTSSCYATSVLNLWAWQILLGVSS